MSTPQQADATSAEFFEAKYRADRDPWRFATDGYEQQRYRSIVAALGERRYRRAFEPGCSVGVLTAMLADRCDAVDAFDFSATAVAEASERCRNLPNVTVGRAAFDGLEPFGQYDLLLLSEIGYYFPRDRWRAIAATVVEAMQPGATLLLSHWLGRSPDHILQGDEVHAAFEGAHQLEHLHGERHTAYRLDVWRRRDA